MKEVIAALEALTKKDAVGRVSKSSKAYEYVHNALTFGMYKIRPNYATGSGRYSGVADHAAAVTALLSRLGLKYEVTNDAPRGGKTGVLITILP